MHVGCVWVSVLHPPWFQICHEAGYVAPSSSCTDQGMVFETAEADAQEASMLQVAMGNSAVMPGFMVIITMNGYLVYTPLVIWWIPINQTWYNHNTLWWKGFSMVLWCLMIRCHLSSSLRCVRYCLRGQNTCQNARWKVRQKVRLKVRSCQIVYDLQCGNMHW